MCTKSKRRGKSSKLSPPTPRTEPRVGQHTIAMLKASQFKGPIPQPEMLEKYNQVHAGLADRIVSMAESEAEHRRAVERDIVHAQIQDAEQERTERRIGQFLALLIALTVVIAGAYVSTHGAAWPGALLGSTGVTGLVMAFLGQRTNQHANKSKGQ